MSTTKLYAFLRSFTKVTLVAGLALIGIGVMSANAQVTNTYTDLHDFGSGSDGKTPETNVVVDADGNIFGTTVLGGAFGQGQAYELTTSGQYIDLHDFSETTQSGQIVSDGYEPSGSLAIDSNGNLFGTAPGGTYGGSGRGGVLWEIPKSGNYVVLHNFGGTITTSHGVSGADGYALGGAVIGPDGAFYGVTGSGGFYNGGMAWRYSTAGQYTDLYDFGATVTWTNGASGLDGTPSGNFYFDPTGAMCGVTTTGGPFNCGMIWKISAPGVIRDLHDFSSGTVTEARCDGLGNLFWVTFRQATTDYPAYLAELTTAGVVEILHYFEFNNAGTSDEAPGAFQIYPNGDLIGICFYGGEYGGGTLWKYSPTGQFSRLHDFGGSVLSSSGQSVSDGTYPYNVLATDQQGDFFGVASEGGDNKQGMLYKYVEPKPAMNYVLSTPSVVSGTSLRGFVQLTGPAGPGGAVITLTSNNPNVIPPKTNIIPPGGTVASFTIATLSVSSSQTAILTATYSGVSAAATLSTSIGPPPVVSLSFAPSTVTGGTTTRGTATLGWPAPSGGVVVKFSSSNADAIPPTQNTIPAGGTTAIFTVNTLPVTVPESVSLMATANGTSVTAPLNLAVTLPTVSSFVLVSSTVTGGTSTRGTVTLSGPAPVGGAVVKFSSDNTNAVPPYLNTIPAGGLTANFAVTTVAVTSSQTANLTASYNNSTGTAVMTINP